MDIIKLCGELEALFDTNQLDEGWSSWLKDYADKVLHCQDRAKRTHLLLELREAEQTFNHLGVYLTNSSKHSDTINSQLHSLLARLDCAVVQELFGTEVNTNSANENRKVLAKE